MCGIFGAAFLPANAKDEVRIDDTLSALAHRGPEGQGVLREDGLVFVHTRLKIVDLSDGGKQPMQTSDGDLTIVFNGEIYNYIELRDELIARGCSFRSQSDTEVLLQGYRVFGEGIVGRIHGMFAFGIWDRKARRLTLARDRTGKKPLYYTGDTQRGFRFASTAGALLASGTPRAFDRTSLPSFLAFGYPRPPRTMYEGISQLPPATIMVIDSGREPVLRRYWTPPFALPKVSYPEEDAIREFKRLFEQAVTRRLRSDVPVGVFLSGGLDSSVIVATMAKLSRKPVKTFTLGFSHDPSYDETAYARMVANRFGTEHTEFQLTPTSFEIIERLVWMHDAPFADSSAVPTAVLSGLTKQHASVAMCGEGGDELLAGYTRFRAIENSAKIPKTVLSALNQALAQVPNFTRKGARARAAFAKGIRVVDRSLLPLEQQLLGWQGYFGLRLHEIIRPEIARELPMDEPLHESAAILSNLPDDASVLSKILHYNFESYLPDDLLVKADRAGMMHALELRSPFLDTELIEFAARLPDSMVRRGRTSKWILRKAYGHMLPKGLLNRKKMGFGIPLGAWFRADLRDYIQTELDSASPIYEYIERSFVETLLREHFHAGMDHGAELWSMLTFSIWLKGLRKPLPL
jgi:asparagine synthase (glutamine-hydrolysing)